MTSTTRAGKPFENGLWKGFRKPFARPNPGAFT